jgi:TRAP-type C4-dicarboxylate transport system substrate-binding protein
MRVSSYLTLIFAGLAFWFAPRAALARELTLLHPGVPGSLYEISVKEFARRVNRRLPVGYRIVPRADPRSGDGPAAIAAIRNGRTTLLLASSALLTISSRFAIFELPYLIRTRNQVRAIRKVLLPAFLQPAAKEKGFAILGVWEDGFRHITNNLRPVSEPHHLRGLGIAIADNRWRAKLLQTLGAEPVPMAPATVPDALRLQRIDGFEAPLTEIAALGLADIQHHLTLSDHLYSPAFLLVRQAELDTLPEKVGKIITAEAIAMEAWIQKTAIMLESDLIDRLDRRMQITHADIDAFRKASRTLYGTFVREVPKGAKMIEIMQSVGEMTAASGTAR